MFAIVKAFLDNSTILYGLHRRVDTFSLLTVFSGVYPVFDTSVPYSLSVSKTCAGAPLSDSAYVVWYRATDAYGNQSPAMPLRAPMA